MTCINIKLLRKLYSTCFLPAESRLQFKQIMSHVPSMIFILLTRSVSGCACAVILICLEQCYHKHKLSKEKRVIKPFAS